MMPVAPCSTVRRLLAAKIRVVPVPVTPVNFEFDEKSSVTPKLPFLSCVGTLRVGCRLGDEVDDVGDTVGACVHTDGPHVLPSQEQHAA